MVPDMKKKPGFEERKNPVLKRRKEKNRFWIPHWRCVCYPIPLSKAWFGKLPGWCR
jgi:hypothetical protein